MVAYPDVTVFCGAPKYIAGRTDTITNPTVLVEVLSRSTALLDRNEKLAEYTSIETLQAYLLVSQNEPKVEQFVRHEAGKWLYESVTGFDASLTVAPLACTLALAKLYSKVNWDEEEWLLLRMEICKYKSR